MAHRKNKKRIDPRYFLEEKTDQYLENPERLPQAAAAALPGVDIVNDYREITTDPVSGPHGSRPDPVEQIFRLGASAAPDFIPAGRAGKWGAGAARALLGAADAEAEYSDKLDPVQQTIKDYFQDPEGIIAKTDPASWKGILARGIATSPALALGGINKTLGRIPSKYLKEIIEEETILALKEELSHMKEGRYIGHQTEPHHEGRTPEERLINRLLIRSKIEKAGGDPQRAAEMFGLGDDEEVVAYLANLMGDPMLDNPNMEESVYRRCKEITQ